MAKNKGKNKKPDTDENLLTNDEDDSVKSNLTFEQHVKLFELRERERESELQVAQRKLDMELEKIRAKANLANVRNKHSDSDSDSDNGQRNNNNRFNFNSACARLCKFDDTDMDDYLNIFEATAREAAWPKDKWVSLLCTMTQVGKAKLVWASLPPNEKDYDVIKGLLLQKYDILPERYRLRFRESKIRNGESYGEYAHYLSINFDRWIKAVGVNNDYEGLKQLLLLENFLDVVSNDLKIHLSEPRVVTLTEAARRADDYTLLHKGVGPNKVVASGTQK